MVVCEVSIFIFRSTRQNQRRVCNLQPFLVNTVYYWLHQTHTWSYFLVITGFLPRSCDIELQLFLWYTTYSITLVLMTYHSQNHAYPHDIPLIESHLSSYLSQNHSCLHDIPLTESHLSSWYTSHGIALVLMIYHSQLSCLSLWYITDSSTSL